MILVERPLHETRFWVSGMPKPRPGELANKYWFKDVTGLAIRPEWEAGPYGWDGYWTVAREHMSLVVEELALRFGQVEVWAECSTLEKCDARCQTARSDNCTCSCLGTRHGEALQASWKQVAATTLVRSDVAEVHRVVTAADVRQTRR